MPGKKNVKKKKKKKKRGEKKKRNEAVDDVGDIADECPLAACR